jgi:hypothetical protein
MTHHPNPITFRRITMQSTLTINDLSVSKELDRDELAAVRGGNGFTQPANFPVDPGIGGPAPFPGYPSDPIYATVRKDIEAYVKGALGSVSHPTPQ